MCIRADEKNWNRAQLWSFSQTPSILDHPVSFVRGWRVTGAIRNCWFTIDMVRSNVCIISTYQNAESIFYSNLTQRWFGENFDMKTIFETDGWLSQFVSYQLSWLENRHKPIRQSYIMQVVKTSCTPLMAQDGKGFFILKKTATVSDIEK